MKYKKGDLLRIDFLDHAQLVRRSDDPSYEDAVPCKAVGYLLVDKGTHFVLSAWISGDLTQDDCDAIIIVKHKGMKVRKLK
jgi:hypothetical protein